jgi:hypothetical protein
MIREMVNMNSSRKSIVIACLLFVTVHFAEAQVGVGTTTPDASAALDITASGSVVGLLLPRLTSSQRDATIKSPTAGLVIYNSSINALQVSISGSLWLNVFNSTTSAAASGTTTSTGRVGIGTTSPNANAALDVMSTTKGILLPRSSSDPTGVAGMIYYNTATDQVRLYNGTAWIVLTS